MKKHLAKVSTLLVGLLLSFGVASSLASNNVKGASAESVVEFDFSEQGYENGQLITEVKLDNFNNVVFDKGTSSNAPKYYDTGTAVRCYGANTLTFNATSGATLSQIDFTFGSDDGGETANPISSDVGTYSDGSWSGSGDKVVFTIGGSKGHRRVQAVKVTYTAGTLVPVTGITMDTKTASVYVKGSTKLIASISPEDATNKTIIWTSSDEEVATVDEFGVVTGVSEGSVTITATTEDGGFSDTATVTAIDLGTPDKVITCDSLNITTTDYNNDPIDVEDLSYIHLKKQSVGANNYITGNSYKPEGASEYLFGALYNNCYLGKQIKTIAVKINAEKTSAETAKTELTFGSQMLGRDEVFEFGAGSERPTNVGGYYVVTPTEEYDYFSLQFTYGTTYIEFIELYYGGEGVRYDVTTNLTNCTSNAPEDVKAGGSLEFTITPNSGYQIVDNDVLVTMGEEILTGVVHNGVVSIAQVTGEVTVTYSAKELVIARMAVTSTTHKVEYKVGDEFSTDNLVVTGYTGSGDTPSFDITEACSITIAENAMRSPGYKTVTIKYRNTMTITYTITVYEITNIKVAAGSIARAKSTDTEFNLDGVHIEGTWGPVDNEITEVLDVELTTNAQVLSGTKSILVRYNYQDLYANQVNVDAIVLIPSVSDTITGEDNPNKGKTSYADWTLEHGGITYKANTAGGNNAFQLRYDTAKDPSGIYLDGNYGFIDKVSIKWNANTAQGRTLNVYGSNTPYTSVADLYSNPGTLIAGFTYDKVNNDAEITVSSSFKYIAVRSNNGALYLDEIHVEFVKEMPWAADLELKDVKEQLFKGDQFEFGGKAILTRSDDTETDVTSLVSFSEVNMNKLGEQEVTVSYTEGVITLKVKYTVTIVDPDEIMSVELDTSSVKTQYLIGDRFTSNKLKVLGTPRRGAKKDVTRDSIVDYSEFDNTKVGTYTIYVTYQDFEPLEYEVDVVKPVNLVNITISLSTDTLYSNEEFRYNGKVTAYYDDGTSEEIDNSRCKFSYVVMSKIGTSDVTISYSRLNAQNQYITKSASYQLTIKYGKEVTSIEIDTDLVRKNYVEGDRFTYEGIKVYANYANSPKAQINSGFAVDFSKVDMFKAGTYEVKVSYANKFATYNVTVSEAPVSVIDILVSEAVIQYKVGDEFIAPKVEATYSDLSKKDVSSDVTCSGYDMSKAGKYTVVVSYTENGVTVTDKYKISVVEEVTLVSIAITSGVKTSYISGEGFEAPQIKATYSDGRVIDITAQVTFSGFDTSTPGEQTITAKFQDKEITFKVTVSPASTGGCGGSVIAGSAIVATLSLLGVGALLLKKKKED